MSVKSQFVMVKLDANETVGLILSEIRWISYQYGGAERVAIVYYGDAGRMFKVRNQEAIDELTKVVEMHHATSVLVAENGPRKEPYNA